MKKMILKITHHKIFLVFIIIYTVLSLADSSVKLCFNPTDIYLWLIAYSGFFWMVAAIRCWIKGEYGFNL